VCLLASALAHAQLRVATWNVSNYDGTNRVADIKTAVYATYQGRSFAPDVIIGQEFISQAGVTAFLNALNTATGSPGDWAAAPFVDGPDTDSALFYRTSKVTLTDAYVVATGGASPNHPRNIMRYTVRLKDYASDGGLLACYSTHMKAQETGSDDEARRLLEAQRIRDNAQTLSAQEHFLLGGDFNIQSSDEAAYQELVGSQANNGGRFFDPINTPGTWNNDSAYRYVHTQDPIGAGGMDDRYDQLLVSGNLTDGDGFEYIGNAALSYSTSTWNDANHSYRAWGNDGTSYNATLTITGNQMVGATIAQALVNVATIAGGHLPVFMDLRVPPVVGADASLDFGLVVQGSAAQAVLQAWNEGNVARWNAAGIADLRYSLAASSGFGVPGGTFVDAAGGVANQHLLTMGTATPGLKTGTLTINSNAPDEPSRVVTLSGEVLAAQTMRGDANCDGRTDFDDINPFVLALTGRSGYAATYPGCPWLNADCNGDNAVNFDDINPFVELLVSP
jgi:endonuclease/exonuclease/phosphatase family metal-dependent hydrolase